jgi:streptogramin lyase
VIRGSRATALWVVAGLALTAAGLVLLLREPAAARRPAPDRQSLHARRVAVPSGTPGKVVVARDGEVWLAERSGGRAVLERLAGHRLVAGALPLPEVTDVTAGGPEEEYLAVSAHREVAWLNRDGGLAGRRRVPGDAVDVSLDRVDRVWIADRGRRALGVTLGSPPRLEEVPLPPEASGLGAIVRAGNGRLWFRAAPGLVGLIEPYGRTYRLFPVPAAAPSPGPDRLTAGPGDAAWLTGGDAVWRVDADGGVRRMAAGLVPAPGPLVTGPDGNVWVAAGRGPELLRLGPDGEAAVFRLDLPARTRIEDLNRDRRRGALWVATSRPRALLEVPLGDLRSTFAGR